MAYNQKNINTLDIRKSIGIGVAIPFNGPSVFKSVYNTRDQIKYNLINYILTNPRERIFNPNFGLGIRKKLFEQITNNTSDEIKQMVISGIENYFPNLNIDKLDVKAEPDNNLLYVEMKYTIKNLRIEDEVSLNFFV
jgi:uncharacterized protein